MPERVDGDDFARQRFPSPWPLSEKHRGDHDAATDDRAQREDFLSDGDRDPRGPRHLGGQDDGDARGVHRRLRPRLKQKSGRRRENRGDEHGNPDVAIRRWHVPVTVHESHDNRDDGNNNQLHDRERVGVRAGTPAPENDDVEGKKDGANHNPDFTDTDSEGIERDNSKSREAETGRDNDLRAQPLAKEQPRENRRRYDV